MDTHAFTQHPAAATKAERPCSGDGQCPLAQCLLCCARAVFFVCGPGALWSILSEVNHQLESRMRENRPSGSEGGGTSRSPYPYTGRHSREESANNSFNHPSFMSNDVRCSYAANLCLTD